MSDPNSYRAERFDGIVHVAKNGSDTRYDLSKYSSSRPFLTISSAIAAAVSGDLVWVHPGVYAERNIALKSGVHMHFDTGATISQTRNAANDFCIGDNGGAVTCDITGYGVFEITDAGNNGDTQGLKITAASTIKFFAKSVAGNQSGVWVTGAANVETHCDVTGRVYAYQQSAGTVVHYGNITGTVTTGARITTTGTQTIYGNVTGGSTYGAECQSGTTQTIYGNVLASDGTTVSCDGGTQKIVGTTITNLAYYAAAVLNAGTQTIENATLTSGGSNVAAVGLSGTAATVVLRNCILRPHGSASEALIRTSGLATHTAKVFACVGTKPLSGAGITVSVNDYLEDADI